MYSKDKSVIDVPELHQKLRACVFALAASPTLHPLLKICRDSLKGRAAQMPVAISLNDFAGEGFVGS